MLLLYGWRPLRAIVVCSLIVQKPPFICKGICFAAKNPCAISLLLTLAGRCFALILAICACKSRGGLSPALVCSRWRAMVSASSLGAPGICVQSKYYTFPAFVTILFQKLRPFYSGICGKTEVGLATRGYEGTSSHLFLSRFFTPKFVTNYIEIYTLVFHDAKICRKYAIFSVFLQCVENQCFMFVIPYSALRILHSVLPLGIFRVAKHA